MNLSSVFFTFFLFFTLSPFSDQIFLTMFLLLFYLFLLPFHLSCSRSLTISVFLSPFPPLTLVLRGARDGSCHVAFCQADCCHSCCVWTCVCSGLELVHSCCGWLSRKHLICHTLRFISPSCRFILGWNSWQRIVLPCWLSLAFTHVRQELIHVCRFQKLLLLLLELSVAAGCVFSNTNL